MMLQHEELTEPTRTAAHSRVTPQELAQAAATLEARKEAERQQQEETIPITDVIQHLGLDVTQDELLAEVEAQRAKVVPKTRPTEQRLYALLNNYQHAVLLIGVLGSILMGVMSVYISDLNSQLKRAQETITRFQTPPPPATIMPISPSISTHPLATVAEGQPVYATFSDVVRLAEGASPQKIMVANVTMSQAPGARQWELLKFRDHFFVRAWRYRPEAVSKYGKHSDDWISAQINAAEDEFADQIPLQRFKAIKEPPSVVDPTTQTNEQIYLPQE